MVALGAILLTWLILGDSSPFDDYFSSHTGLPNLWRALNAVPFILGAVISDNRGGGPFVLFTILQFIQWFLIAFILSTLFALLSRRS